MSTWSTVAAVVGVSAFASLYTLGMGQSALESSAEQITSVSNRVVTQWGNITAEFGIDRAKTGTGQLVPVVDGNYSALDLAVYGGSVVNAPYNQVFETANITPLFDEIYVRTDDGVLSYWAGGIKIAGVQDIEGRGLAVMFLDMPEQLRKKVTLDLLANDVSGQLITMEETDEGLLSALVIPYPNALNTQKSDYTRSL